MSHRKAGIKGIKQQQQKRQQFQQKSNQVFADYSEQLSTSLELLKQNLEEFALKHQAEIKNNPVFRQKFHEMCMQVGVDPLSSNKSFWTKVLGFGDFYYQIALQVVQICMITREMNGGLIEWSELKSRMETLRGRYAQPISDQDLVQALKCLGPFGDGFGILEMGTKKMVRSIPQETNMDGLAVLAKIEDKGVTAEQLQVMLGWSHERCQVVLDSFVQQAICWIDLQNDPPAYWIAGMVM
jgi:ESCRT-II complex subunit VPS22